MEKAKTKIEIILENIGKHRDDANWLSGSCLALTSHLYYHNTLMSEARLAEKTVVISCLENMKVGDKRMSVAEAEKRAVVETGNAYGILKTQGDAIVEAINAIKVRVKVLSWERQNANN